MHAKLQYSYKTSKERLKSGVADYNIDGRTDGHV